jgi:hypothetical protein
MVRDYVKENPLKTVASIITTCGVIIGGVLTVDERYAHAVDVEKVQQQTARTIETQIGGIRRQMLEDKLFELDTKREVNKGLSPVDEAQYKRYNRQLMELNEVQRQIK